MLGLCLPQVLESVQLFLPATSRACAFPQPGGRLVSHYLWPAQRASPSAVSVLDGPTSLGPVASGSTLFCPLAWAEFIALRLCWLAPIRVVFRSPPTTEAPLLRSQL